MPARKRLRKSRQDEDAAASADESVIGPPRSSSLHTSLKELGELLGLALINGCQNDHQAIDYTQKPDLSAFLRNLPPADYDGVWERIVEVSKEHLRTECFQQHERDEPTADVSLHMLWAVASLIICFVETVLDALRQNLPPAFTEAAMLCRDLLLNIPEDSQQQQLVADALELISNSSIEGCEQFYGALVLFLLDKCRTAKATGADVNRLYKLRHLLSELNWEHESIESVKVRILHCVANPHFAVKRHGSDLMAMFYIVSPSFTADVNDAIKKQVVSCRSASLKAYAMSLWKALHLARDEAIEKVEKCIQDWIVLAVRTTRKSADKARAVLDEIHRCHLEPLEREMLCRCYGPVLWRSLKVANWQVRENSTKILSAIFPLIPPDAAVEAQELETMKQLRLLQETLEDTNEHVRRAGVTAACQIMKDYWDLIPNQACAQLLTVIKDQCVRDRRAPAVRAAVADGFVHILENPCTFPAMEVILSEVGPKLLHDRSALVRSAFAGLLNTVSRCRGISRDKIASHDDILLALSAEHATSLAEKHERSALGKKGISEIHTSTEAVAKRLTQLTADSLFSGSLSEQVRCCHELLRHYPLPLVSLISNAGDFVPLLDRLKLAVALFHEGKKELQRMLEGPSQGAGKQTSVTVLRAAGALLEGIHGRSEKKRGQSESQFSPELQNFIYTHIRDEELMPFIRSPHLVDCMWADLLFVVSPLDPRKLPRLADFVQRKINAISTGECKLPTCIRLGALLHIAVTWDILGNALEPTWQYLLDAADNFGVGDIEEERLDQALRIADMIFRDSVLRGVTLQSKAEQFLLKQTISKFVNLFSETWSEGVEQLSKARKGSQKAWLGPMARFWPNILGLILRISHHLEFRVPKSTADDRAEDAVDSLASPLHVVRTQIMSALHGQKALDLLEHLESSAGTCSAGSPQKKPRLSRSVVLPSDIDLILQIYGRFAESLNVSSYLGPLVSVVEHRDDEKQMYNTRVQQADDILWRWASVADEMVPSDDGARRADSWVTSAHLFQQMFRMRLSTAQIISISSKLFGRITCDVPADNSDIKKMLQPLFFRFEFQEDHDFCDFIRRLLGDEPGSQSIEPSGRLAACIKEELERFRRLRTKLLPQEVSGVDGADAIHDQGHRKDVDLSKVISSLSRCQNRELPSPCRNLTRA